MSEWRWNGHEDAENGCDPGAEVSGGYDEAADLERMALERAAQRRYFNVTRTLSAGLLFSLPLLLIYEAGVIADINAAAVWVKWPISSWLRRHPMEMMGARVTLVVNGLLAVGVIVAAWRVARLGALHVGTFGGMFSESAVYALLLGPVALLPMIGRWEFPGLTLNTGDLWPKMVISAGAGFYEEFVFRFLLLGAVYFLAKELGKVGAVGAGAIALMVSGAVFSAVHFLSPQSEPDYAAFLYRLMAGLLLGVIYLTRGFGVAAWTHALYDMYVLCLPPHQ